MTGNRYRRLVVMFNNVKASDSTSKRAYNSALQMIDGRAGIEMLKIEAAFLRANLLIGGFQHGKVEVFLVTDMVIQHTLVGVGFSGDAIDPGAGEAVRSKFLLRGL